MNTKLYKKVHELALALLDYSEKEQPELFSERYQALKALCYEHEDDEHKNHPLQWETLADFTEDRDEAMRFYQKALGYGEERQASDYCASIRYAMAQLAAEASKPELAKEHIAAAKTHMANVNDAQLAEEIQALADTLSAESADER